MKIRKNLSARNLESQKRIEIVKAIKIAEERQIH